jgi:hypothetical protein
MDEDKANWLATVTPHPLPDGIALTVLRISWWPFVLWHFLVFRPWMLLTGSLVFKIFNSNAWDEGRFKQVWFLLVDAYCIAWTVGLSINYCYALATVQSIARGDRHYDFYMLISGAIASLRLYELWAFIGGLHAKSEYITFSKPRAIANTFWHYFESIAAFATVYLWVAALTGDLFASSPIPDCEPKSVADGGAIAGHWLTPLYFSTISIATVGYGDFSPQTSLGRFVVVLQIIFGIFLLVVILQRAMSGGEEKAS